MNFNDQMEIFKEQASNLKKPVLTNYDTLSKAVELVSGPFAKDIGVDCFDTDIYEAVYETTDS